MLGATQKRIFVGVYFGLLLYLLAVVLVSAKRVCQALETQATACQSKQGKTKLQFI